MDVASIERDTSEVIRLGTREVFDQGGEEAVNQYLRNNICTLVAAAYSRLGPTNTCQLMWEGLMTAEAMAGNVR